MNILKISTGLYLVTILWTLTLQVNVKRVRRASYMNGIALWQDGIIPYTKDDALPAGVSSNVDAAIQVLKDVTCINFVKEGEDGYSEKSPDGIVKFKRDSSCESKVGKVVVDGYHTIGLADGCGLQEYTPFHEIGHALGLRHEHNREDRDDYINVIYDNVAAGNESEFDKEQNSNLDFKFDISSLMQYPSSAYHDDNNEKTMIPVAPILYNSLPWDNLGGIVRWKHLGQGYLSHRDIATINKLYSCAASCTVKACQNGGYQDKSCACQCTLGFSGELCEAFDLTGPEHHNEVCGSNERTAADEPTIMPPQKGSGFFFGKKCFWRIKGGENQIIRVKLVTLKIDKTSALLGVKKDGECEPPNGDLLYIYLYGTDVSVFPVRCADKSHFMNTWSYSDSNQVFVKWNSTKYKKTIFDPANQIYKTKNVKTATNVGWKLKFEIGAFVDGAFVVGATG